MKQKNPRAPSGAAPSSPRAPSGAASPVSDPSATPRRGSANLQLPPSGGQAIPGAEAPLSGSARALPSCGDSRSTASSGRSALASGFCRDTLNFRDASASTLAERPTGATLPRFARATRLFIDNDVTRWHLAHGWIWNVSSSDNSPLGVFYCTLLCGDGCIIHFDALPHIPWTAILPAFKKAIRMISPVSDVVYATVPDSRAKLIRILIRLNFAPVSSGGFLRDQTTPVTLLKLIK